jgi:hypothetical protein
MADDEAQTGKFGGKMPPKMNCRESVFKKLATAPENLKASNYLALP